MAVISNSSVTLSRISHMTLLLLFAACIQSCGIGGYHVRDVAKTDTSLVIETHYQQTREILKELTGKFYKRNPSQLPTSKTVDERVASLFGVHDGVGFSECGPGVEIELMEASLKESFRGDRVFCLMAGLVGMINHSFAYKDSFYVTDTLDQQKIYHSARNLERLSWRLRQASANSNQPLLLSNSVEPGHINMSFERLFGKVIALQDILALIVADQNKRAINYVVRRIGSFFFLPL
ncbi:MAG: hypothetical protein AB8B48_07885 [Pseudomonadales bacterium]